MAEKCVKAMNSQPILSPPRAVVVPRVRVGIQSGHLVTITAPELQMTRHTLCSFMRLPRVN